MLAANQNENPGGACGAMGSEIFFRAEKADDQSDGREREETRPHTPSLFLVSFRRAPTSSAAAAAAAGMAWLGFAETEERVFRLNCCSRTISFLAAAALPPALDASCKRCTSQKKKTRSDRARSRRGGEGGGWNAQDRGDDVPHNGTGEGIAHCCMRSLFLKVFCVCAVQCEDSCTRISFFRPKDVVACFRRYEKQIGHLYSRISYESTRTASKSQLLARSSHGRKTSHTLAHAPRTVKYSSSYPRQLLSKPSKLILRDMLLGFELESRLKWPSSIVKTRTAL